MRPFHARKAAQRVMEPGGMVSIRMSREANRGLAGQGCLLHLRLVGQSAPADVVRKTGAGWVRTAERWGIKIGGTCARVARPEAFIFAGTGRAPQGPAACKDCAF